MELQFQQLDYLKKIQANPGSLVGRGELNVVVVKSLETLGLVRTEFTPGQVYPKRRAMSPSITKVWITEQGNAYLESQI